MTARLNGHEFRTRRDQPAPRKFCQDCVHCAPMERLAETDLYCRHALSQEKGPDYSETGITSYYLCRDMRQSGRCGMHAQYFQPKTTENDQ